MTLTCIPRQPLCGHCFTSFAMTVCHHEGQLWVMAIQHKQSKSPCPIGGRILEGFKTFKEPSHNDKLSTGSIPQNKKTRFFSGLLYSFYLSHSKGHWLFNRLLIFKFHRYLDSIGSFFIKSLRHLNTFSTITWKRLALISKWPINFFWQSIKI